MDINFMKSKFMINNYKKTRGLIDPQRTERTVPVIRKQDYFEAEGKSRKYPIHPNHHIDLSN